MPKLTVIAGQNGAGKSTLTRMQKLQTIDPDRVAREGLKGQYQSTDAANLAAGRLVIQQQKEAIQEGRSFAVFGVVT